jgi:hypothetical protein
MRRLFVWAMIIAAGPAQAAEREPPPVPGRLFATTAERQAVADYRARLEAYQQARAAHEERAAAYWQTVSTKRTARRAKVAGGGKATLSDYVLEQPPVYTGPELPKRPEFMPPPPKPAAPKRRAKRIRPAIPVVKDFLRDAKSKFRFAPQLPGHEAGYKRAYVRMALEAGISKDQAVRIYGFEASGNGKYDVQAGLESGKPGGRAISTALGYNQLLVANTIGLVAKHGSDFIDRLNERAKQAKGARRKELNLKIVALRRMHRYARALPYRWSVHVDAAQNAKGRGLHALVLDVDIGPMLQAQKLLTSIQYAQARGIEKRLTAAELEMFNLTGDGNGLDMLSLPVDMREKVPTSNFFERGGYERNPIASRNNVVAKLLAETDRKMDYHAALDGAKEMAAIFEEMAKAASSGMVGATN